MLSNFSETASLFISQASRPDSLNKNLRYTITIKITVIISRALTHSYSIRLQKLTLFKSE